jgi:hypothetical protein
MSATVTTDLTFVMTGETGETLAACPAARETRRDREKEDEARNRPLNGSDMGGSEELQRRLRAERGSKHLHYSTLAPAA